MALVHKSGAGRGAAAGRRHGVLEVDAQALDVQLGRFVAQALHVAGDKQRATGERMSVHPQIDRLDAGTGQEVPQALQRKMVICPQPRAGRGRKQPGRRDGLSHGMSIFDLDRFTKAQAPVIDQVRRELAAASKRTHWMWFIFPQLRGLGRSPTAQHFGLAGQDEARAYLADPVLGSRLVECTALVNHIEGKTAEAILGSPDNMKFRSCMTLFATLQAQPFENALRKYFDSKPDSMTLELLRAA